MANPNIAEYGKNTRLTANDPRRINKPMGARMRQITRARKRLEEPCIVDGKICEDFTEFDALLEIQIGIAKKAKDATAMTQAFKAVMDYAGYKPSEKIEFDDVTEKMEFESEEQEREFRIHRMREMLNSTDEVVNEAQQIADNL